MNYENKCLSEKFRTLTHIFFYQIFIEFILKVEVRYFSFIEIVRVITIYKNQREKHNI